MTTLNQNMTLKVTEEPVVELWESLLARPLNNSAQFEASIQMVLDEVKSKGDEAVNKYTRHFDQVDLTDFKVSEAELEAAEIRVEESLKIAIRQAAANITKFHQAQGDEVVKIETMPGVTCWRKKCSD